MSVFLLVNTNRKGGEYLIVIQQVRRAMEVTIARGNINHKIVRLHYVGGITEEA
jgi:hypothetical protein